MIEIKCWNILQFVREVLRERNTIQVLNLRQHFMDQYEQELKKVRLPFMEDLRAKSILFGYSQSVPFFAYAGCMFYGGVLLQAEEIDFKDFFKYVSLNFFLLVLLGRRSRNEFRESFYFTQSFNLTNYIQRFCFESLFSNSKIKSNRLFFSSRLRC